jgi:uncharacterized RDD family membrane protein YckC
MNPPQPEHSLSGHYAGPASRLAAFAVDAVLSLGIFAVCSAGLFFVLGLVVGTDVDESDLPEWLWTLLLVAWLAVYFGYCWAASGKTPGMALLGLRVVADEGEDATTGHALVRLAVFPLSLAFVVLGCAGIVLGERHRALHDVLARTVVVYDWDARAARLRFLARRRRA